MMKKMVMLCITILFVVCAMTGYGFYRAVKTPANNAEAFLKAKIDPSKKIAVLMGDSLTHGAVSYNYVEELSKDHDVSHFIFINEGINSQFAYHQLNKVDQVAGAKPHEILILIGTNDCRATLSAAEYERFNALWKLPVQPTQEWYAHNLKTLVDKLKEKTRARITLISIPPLGEKVDSIPFQKSIEYSHDIKRIAEEKNVGYIALNEALTEAIIKNGRKDIKGYELDLRSMYGAIFSHYLLLQSWDDISDQRGLLFLTDHLHLNRRGGNILITKIKERLLSK